MTTSADSQEAARRGERDPVRVGVLAIQGGFEAHGSAIEEVGAEAVEVRTPRDLEGLEGLILPGGESSTIAMGVEAAGLGEGIVAHHRARRPILATCAGMILVSRDHLDLVDIETRRNAFGRQLSSFEADIELSILGPPPLRSVFIRAPWVESAGPSVEVLATYEGHPVAVRQGPTTAVSFHPELTPDRRLHQDLIART